MYILYSRGLQNANCRCVTDVCICSAEAVLQADAVAALQVDAVAVWRSLQSLITDITTECSSAGWFLFWILILKFFPVNLAAWIAAALVTWKIDIEVWMIYLGGATQKSVLQWCICLGIIKFILLFMRFYVLWWAEFG